MLDHLPSRLAVAWGLREALRAFTALPAFCVSYLSGARVKWQFECHNQGQCGSSAGAAHQGTTHQPSDAFKNWMPSRIPAKQSVG